MTTLYLHVPKDKADGEGKKSYADTLQSAVGSGYAIPRSQAALCVPGSSNESRRYLLLMC